MLTAWFGASYESNTVSVTKREIACLALSTDAQHPKAASLADGHLSGVQVLIATAITGVAQAVIGGQPLLIVGVAEPIVLIYSFMYQFVKGWLRPCLDSDERYCRYLFMA